MQYISRYLPISKLSKYTITQDYGPQKLWLDNSLEIKHVFHITRAETSEKGPPRGHPQNIQLKLVKPF